MERLLVVDDGVPSRAGETGPGTVRSGEHVAQLASWCWCVIS